MRYYIGLDNGGTITKAALYTNRGEQIGVCSVETSAITPKPGFVERDMDLMWAANCVVLRELLKETAIDPANVAAIACCGHGKGLYLWGKDDKPVRNGIISTDNRAWGYPHRWEIDGTARKVFGLSYQKILACQPVSLLAWLRDNEPDSFVNIRWIFECKDYVRFKLTGEAFAEITDYSGANLLNLKTCQYDAKLMALFGIESLIDSLPQLRKSTDICGHITAQVEKLTGLKTGTPVVGGMFDIDACAIAVDAVHENRLCMIAGTWSINEYISRNPVLDGTVMMNSLFCLPEYYLIEECSPTSAGNNEWFITTMLPELKQQAKAEGRSVYDVINSLIESIPVNEFCPIFLPFLMASNVHQNAKAAFVGISNYHSRAHLLKGLYEGVAFSHKYHLDRLIATRSEPISEIRLAGGAANSEVWAQIFADVMGYPIETVAVGETGTLGCAMAAAVGVGEYKNFADAASNMIRIKSRVEPIAENIESYREKYTLYKQMIEALDPVWDNVQKLIEK